MLIGEYQHTLDSKKRLAIPAKLRKEFGERVIVTGGEDSCLFVYPMGEWQKLTDKLSALPQGQKATRDFLRHTFSSAVEIELDHLGRILIPDYLKNHAGLRQRIVIAGVFNRLEIWDEERWVNYKAETGKNTDMIAEKLGELGLY